MSESKPVSPAAPGERKVGGCAGCGFTYEVGTEWNPPGASLSSAAMAEREMDDMVDELDSMLTEFAATCYDYKAGPSTANRTHRENAAGKIKSWLRALLRSRTQPVGEPVMDAIVEEFEQAVMVQTRHPRDGAAFIRYQTSKAALMQHLTHAGGVGEPELWQARLQGGWSLLGYVSEKEARYWNPEATDFRPLYASPQPASVDVEPSLDEEWEAVRPMLAEAQIDAIVEEMVGKFSLFVPADVFATEARFILRRALGTQKGGE